MKKANFDVSHELDEFLMVEKPLTHSKRKANPDLDKMKPELRQLEEQCVLTFSMSHTFTNCCYPAHRFTVYDFSRNKRMSYYPHNQPIATLHDGLTDGDGTTTVQSHAGTLLPTATIVERSQAGSPALEGQNPLDQPPLPNPRPSTHSGRSVPRERDSPNLNVN